MLTANGFEVHDLGVDVPPAKFVATARETGAQIIGLSALLTTTMVVQRKVIEALEAEGLRSKVRVIVGGAPVSQSWAEEIGADGYAEDSTGAVDLARRLVATS
jgi:methanogenic corrinoid protein MtbC1